MTMNSSRFFQSPDSPLPAGEGRVRAYPLAMNMSNTLGYLKGELKGGETKKRVSFGKRVLEFSPIKRMLLAVYNKIFHWYYS